MPEGRAPISSSRIAAGDIARHSFAIVRRGYDTDEVRAYLQSLSRSIEALEEREQELRDAAAEAEARAAHPVIDESTLTASLGQHSAQILRHAHEEAARIVAQAREDTAALLRETQSQVDELQTRTEASSAERVVEVELLVANAEQEARVESERIVAEAIAQGEAVVTRAKDEGRTLLEQVQEARRRVLADLAARRRTLGVQIEALRAARDEMAASVHGVRDRVDGILAHLDRTDDEARAAAQSVSEQFRLHGGPHDQDEADGVGDAMSGAPPTGPTPAAAGDAPDAVDVEGGDGGGIPPGAPSVDELFARIRAGSETAGAGAGGGTAVTAAVPVADETAAVPVADETAALPVVEAAASAPDEALPGPDDLVIARRDELLSPVTARLSRTVKRALGDDQNRLLDQLRNTPSTPSEELLGPEDAHVDTFAAAANEHLREAFTAGTVFAGAGTARVAEGDAVAQSAAGLAHVVVTMLRGKILDTGGDTADKVGAAYREWRGERVERLAGDYATQAFSAGVAASRADGKLRWVVASASGCSDCADNALAGAVSTSEGFPTGHAHPPAHSGCRCLVAAADD
jgi:DivIVA domain-containing protein